MTWHINKDARDELMVLSKKADGPLHPTDVVKWARKNTTSALHGLFEWDDSKAAERYRVTQARTFMATIYITPAETGQPTRALVSIMRDRTNGGGYRSLAEVMGDELMATQIILEALREAKRWSFKYQHLTQLRDVHKAIEKVAKRIEPELAPPEQEAELRKAQAV